MPVLLQSRSVSFITSDRALSHSLAVLVGIGHSRSSLLVNSSGIRVDVSHLVVLNIIVNSSDVDKSIVRVKRSPLS